MKDIINPIKDNRIVNDYTFATRLINFLKDFYPEAGSWHPIETEEYEYICLVAKKLLDYQIQTCDSEEEKKYFENLKPNLINDNPFEKFLNNLKYGK